MAKLTYAEQLKHPNWQRRRLERLNQSGWTCEDCGNDDVTLHVHHKRYVKGRSVWEYPDEELAVLCEDCHSIATMQQNDLAALLVGASLEESLALCAGFNCLNDCVDREIIYRMSEVEPLTFHVGVCAQLVAHLGINNIAKVAEFAASLTHPNSECRELEKQWFGKFRK